MSAETKPLNPYLVALVVLAARRRLHPVDPIDPGRSISRPDRDR